MYVTYLNARHLAVCDMHIFQRQLLLFIIGILIETYFKFSHLEIFLNTCLVLLDKKRIRHDSTFGIFERFLIFIMLPV